uniref:AlNc14C80G5243 protein n=1 Tax=Albugo laibachii Nc14 TaxID=890382 RepID=F0WF49_9STRA|nr:AlNc14C80G5243 [Albugo laibachii Nc14]|eukprot:CCA19831.1 AlNc14C80G5243 [Albugo laibachii Nc14]
MLNRFVLSRKYERDSTHFQLIKSEFLYLPNTGGGLQVLLLESTLKKHRLQFLQQFAAQSSSSQLNWTSPGIQILQCALPDFGPYHALDILTISPRRHSNMVLWRKASPWWKQTCVWWHQSTWDITINALSPQERFLHLLNTPIWFPIDPRLHFERQRRSTRASAHRRYLGMAFRIRSLHDFTSAVGTPSDPSTSKFLRRLYIEATQILRRAQPEGVLLCLDRPPPRPYRSFFGIQLSGKPFFFPNIPRNQLFRAVGKAIPPDKPHPLLLHVAERDRGGAPIWVMDFCKLFNRLRRCLLPIYSDIQFRLSFCILPVRARFSFLQQANPDIILCTQIHCGGIEVTSTYFSTAVGHVHFGTSSFRLGHLSFWFDPVGLTSRVLDCLPFVLREHLSDRTLKIYGLLWSRSRFILSGRIGTEDFSTTAPQHLLLQLFR